MRTLPLALLISTPLLLAACSSGTAPTSPSVAGSGQPSLGAVLQTETQLQAALGLYRIELDPATLQGTVALVANRSGAANDDLYLLPIDNFLRPTSLRLTGIQSTATTLDIDYRFAHPFAAPSNINGAPTAANRADLGVAAALLILADQPTASGNTYFTDRVVNTDLVLNADSYWDPGALVDTTGLTANTFPLQLLVDETGTDGNRLGVSNGGDPTGNFGSDGWTKAELSISPDSWTGFGILHQGQTVAGTLSLSRAEVAASGFSFDVAILAKYNDPRGGATSAEKRANRLPGDIPDAGQFAYRMPHGAWDCSNVEFVDGGLPYTVGTFSSADLSFRVVDWDARAIETSVGDLSGDTDVTTVAIGESGVPSVSVCIPGITGDSTSSSDYLLGAIDDDSTFGGDATQDSGRPGDALFFSEAVESTLTGPASGGTYAGLARVTDPEVANITDPAFVIELDGNLTPLSSGIPTPVVYQAFEVTAQTPVSASGFALQLGGAGGDEGWSIAVDASGNMYIGGNFYGTIDFGGGPHTSGASNDYTCFVVKLDPTGAFLWDHVFGSTQATFVEGVEGIGLDAAGNVYAAGYARGTVDFGGGPHNGTGFQDAFLVKYDNAGAYQWHRAFGPPSNLNSTQALDVAVDSAGNAYMGGYFNTTVTPPGGSAMTSPSGTADAFLVKYNSAGAWQWNRQFGGNGTTWTDSVDGVAIDAAGDIYASGKVSTTVDFGGGPTTGDTGADAYIAKYSPSNVFQWVRRSTGGGFAWASDVAAGTDRVVMVGFYTTDLDLGGGVHVGGGTDMFLGAYTIANGFLWEKYYSSTSSDWGRTIAMDPTNNDVYMMGAYSQTLDFGGGVRTNAGRDLSAVKLNGSGVYQWDSQWGGSSTDDGYGVTVGPGGHPYFIGYFQGTGVDMEPGPNVTTFNSFGSRDIFVMKLLKTTGMW